MPQLELATYPEPTQDTTSLGPQRPSKGNAVLMFLLTLISTIALASVGSWALSIDHRVSEAEARIVALEKTNIEVNTKRDIVIKQTSK